MTEEDQISHWKLLDQRRGIQLFLSNSQDRKQLDWIGRGGECVEIELNRAINRTDYINTFIDNVTDACTPEFNPTFRFRL